MIQCVQIQQYREVIFMKIDDVRKLATFDLQYTPEDQQRLHTVLQSLGIDPNHLYQELEMSSRFVNTHRDTTYSNAMVSLHSHTFYELLCCRSSGQIEYLIGSDRYRLQKGDIIFIPPGISHRPIFPDQMDEPYIRDVIWISQEFMTALEESFPSPISRNSSHYVMIRTAGTRWDFLTEMFQNGVREEWHKQPNWEAVVSANTMMILSYLERAYTEHSGGTLTTEKPQLLDRITAYVENHFTEHITVNDLARRFYVSESTISHLFKQKMGVSLYRYITQRRLIAAKLLIADKQPMEEIAHRLGFSDYSTFYRAFKQEFGISPRQYRSMQDN